MRLGAFFHFGLNTFHGVEWSDGTLPAAGFVPGELDADQWVRTARELGARYVVLTAKHHDGFCLWPTATTAYSVAASPWRGGAGDVVREVADACARHGLGLGLYLSPWDRNAPQYADPAAYDDFYAAQLRELCGNYGDIAEIWFDGAGSEGRVYDWGRYLEVVRELQPRAMVFNMGAPTIRWVGNEDGLAADPVRYAVDRGELSNYTDDRVDYGGALYLPPECDVSIRHGWFWAEHDEPKSLDHLLAIYYGSVGLGANLLLNLPPDTRGLIPDTDVARVRELRAELDRRFGDPLAAELSATADGWRADFAAEIELDHLLLQEELADGQRVTGFEVVTDAGEPVARGGSIGAQRLCVFPMRRVRSLTVRVGGEGAALSGVTGFRTGVSTVPSIEYAAPTDPPRNEAGPLR